MFPTWFLQQKFSKLPPPVYGTIQALRKVIWTQHLTSMGKSQNSTPVSRAHPLGKLSHVVILYSLALCWTSLSLPVSFLAYIWIAMASTLASAEPDLKPMVPITIDWLTLCQFLMSACSRNHLKCLSSFQRLNMLHDVQTWTLAAMFRIQPLLIRTRKDPGKKKN